MSTEMMAVMDRVLWDMMVLAGEASGCLRCASLPTAAMDIIMADIFMVHGRPG